MTAGIGWSRRVVLAGGLASIATTAARAQAKKDVANITMVSGVSGLVIHQVAKAAGYFDQLNIEPNLLLVSDGTKTTAALISGSADICMWSGFNQIFPAIEKGAKLKILGGSLNLAPLALYSHNPNIKSVEDLAGKTIGIGALGAVMHQMIVLVLQKNGVDTKTIQWRNVGATPDIFKAVVAGTVDAGVAEVDMYDRQAYYGVHVLKDGEFWSEIPEYTNQGTYAADTAIAAKRELLVRVLATYEKAYRYVSGPDSKDAYLAAHKVVTNEEDPQEATTYWNFIQKYKPYDLDLVLSDDRLTLVQNLNVQYGVQSKVLAPADVSDMSLAKDALKLLG